MRSNTYHIQVKMIIRGIDMWQKFGMSLSRNSKPADLRHLATQYTGKPYARSDKGLTQARTDLVAYLAAIGMQPCKD